MEKRKATVRRSSARLIAITCLLITSAAGENSKIIGHSKTTKLNIRPYPCSPAGTVCPPQPQLTCRDRPIRTVGPKDALEILDGGQKSHCFFKVEVDQLTGWAWANSIDIPIAPPPVTSCLPPWPVWAIFALVSALAGVYCFLAWNGTQKGVRKGLPDEESRKMYHETLRTLVTAAGIGIPVIAAVLKNESAVAQICILKWAVLLLMLAVVFSIATLLEMSRHYAHARGTTDAQGDTLESTVTSIASIVNDKSTTIQEKLRAILRIELDYVRSNLASKGAAVSKQASAELCALAWAAITTFGWGLICVVWFVFA